MELRLLGPVELRAGGQVVPIGPPQRQVVLAALAVDVGRVVTRHTLVDRIWSDAPSARPEAAIYSHVAHLRRLLQQSGDARLERVTGGYLLRVDPDAVDLHRFRALVSQAAKPDLPAGERAALLRRALRLWRGLAVAGLPGDWLARMRETWGQERLAAVVGWASAEMLEGRAGRVVAPLEELAGEHPLAESVAAALMRALAATGRPADALGQYAKLQRRLADELGADPSAELQQLHHDVLRGEPAADPPMPTPTQLPHDIAGFTGRGVELAWLDQAASGGTIQVLTGGGGVGKTALAVRWAHRARRRFPDGQLYADLRGFHPGHPSDPGQVLADFLAALGVPAGQVPLDLDARAARFRTETADRRMLVVLDNAGSIEQIRPLLPGTSSCAVVVTSRESLGGLVAVDGAERLVVDPLPGPEALDLLGRLIGERVDAEPQAATQLTQLCARLPLALRVVAELATTQPATPLSDLVAELTDERQRVARLGVGDAYADVGTVFSWSLRHVPPGAARLFRLLGLHPGIDFDAPAAAALAGVDVPQGRRLLERLARASLIDPAGGGRYTMHDLLRSYTAGLTDTDEDDAALDRLADLYLVGAARAMDTLHPAEQHRRPAVAANAPAASPGTPEAARRWLTAEQPNLIAVAVHCAAHGRPARTVAFSRILFRFLDAGYYADGVTLYRSAVDAARAVGDADGEAHALSNLGVMSGLRGQFADSREYTLRALALFRRAGDGYGQARTVNNLAIVNERFGRYRLARGQVRHAIALFIENGDTPSRARSLANLARIEGYLGDDEMAVAHLLEAVALCRRLGLHEMQAQALNTLGIQDTRVGRHRSAIDRIHQAIEVNRHTANQGQEAQMLDSLATAYLAVGEPERAIDNAGRAVALFRTVGDRDGESSAHNCLGEASLRLGKAAEAVEHHTEALAITAQTGVRDQHARAHRGLAHAHHALSDAALARDHATQALETYTALGWPELDEIRAELAGF